jgi:hypothetical protein
MEYWVLFRLIGKKRSIKNIYREVVKIDPITIDLVTEVIWF